MLGPSCANRIGAGPSSSPPRPRRCAARAAQPAVLFTAPVVSQHSPAEAPAACHVIPPLPVSCGPLSPLVAELEAALQHPAFEPSLERQLLSRSEQQPAASVVPSTRVRRGPGSKAQAAESDSLQTQEAQQEHGLPSASSAGGVTGSGRLSAAQERKLSKAVQLSKRIEKAAAEYAARHGRPPTALQLALDTGFPDAVAVEAVLRKGWAARQQLVDANRGLVVHLALKLRNHGVDLPDLIAEGMAALDAAAAAFRPDAAEGRGSSGPLRFCSLGGTAAYRSMLRAVHSYGRVVPLPVRMHQTMVQVRKAQRSLRLELHRDPTSAELAAACGLKVEEVQRLERTFRQPVLGVGEGRGEVHGEDVVACDAEDWESNDLFASGLMLDLTKEIQALKPNQRQVVALRHGLEDATPRTWKEVGAEMKLTHQRVQKIHAAAIEELRKQLQAS